MHILRIARLAAILAVAMLAGSAGLVAQNTATPAGPVKKGPVAWSGPAAALSGTAGSRIPVTLAVAIAPGWHIYALTQKPGGPTPLEITVPGKQPFTLGGAITAPKPDVKFDEGFKMDVLLISGRAQFVVPVAVGKSPPGARSIAVEMRYQACNDTLCMPARTDRLEIPVVIK